MKNIIKFCLLSLLCSISNTSIAQQNTSSSDTSYPTSFAFTDAEGNPLGYYLYRIENVESGFGVFQYTDGRKFVGSISYGQPDVKKMNRVYYPDGTIYMGMTPINISTPYIDFENNQPSYIGKAAIYYPDGSKFVGTAINYKDRLGFLFAPDGSYMMGKFWWKKPYNFVTTYFDKNHNLLADKYSLGYDRPETDLEQYLKIQKKEKPLPERYGNEKVVWDNNHKKYKYNGENTESDYIGWETQKSTIGIGGFAWERYKYGDTTRFTSGISHRVSTGAWSYYTTPGYQAKISISLSETFEMGAVREQWDTATMEFNTIKPKDAATNPERYMEYHICNDGRTYLGEAWFNRANGYGILYDPANSSTYFGDLAFGKRHGYGTYKYKDGSYIKGNWKDDKRFGFSKSYNAKGELIEEGDYVDGNKVKLQKDVDLGYYAFVDEYPIPKNEPPLNTTYVTKKLLTEGAIYTGNINKNLPEGDGELTMANGDIYKGKWHNGEPLGVCTVIYKPVLVDGKISNAVYKGSLKDFRWEGEGRLVQDSIQLIGTFKQGKFNGSGTVVWHDGFTEKGGWYNGQREGIINVYDKKGNELGYSTYKNGVKNGDSKEIYLIQNRQATGNFVNGKMEGEWEVSDRGTQWYNGKHMINLSRLGSITYKNGIEISSQNNPEIRQDYSQHNDDNQRYEKSAPVKKTKAATSYSEHTCPRCNGSGRENVTDRYGNTTSQTCGLCNGARTIH